MSSRVEDSILIQFILFDFDSQPISAYFFLINKKKTEKRHWREKTENSSSRKERKKNSFRCFSIGIGARNSKLKSVLDNNLVAKMSK